MYIIVDNTVSTHPAAGMTSCHSIICTFTRLPLPPCKWKSPAPPGIPYMIIRCARLRRIWPITRKEKTKHQLDEDASERGQKRLCKDGQQIDNRLDLDGKKAARVSSMIPQWHWCAYFGHPTIMVFTILIGRWTPWFRELFGGLCNKTHFLALVRFYVGTSDVGRVIP